MLFIYIGLFTIFLAFIWGFFIVAKIHAYKFKNLSDNIEKFTKILTVVLLILSILGYVSIIFYGSGKNTYQIDTTSDDYSEFENISY